MLEQFKSFYRVFLISILTFTLQACGGSSSDSAPSYTISADVSSAHYNVSLGQASTDSLTINVNFTGAGVALGFAPDSTIPPWLTYRTETVTATQARIIVDVVNAEFLPANLYETTLRLSTADETGSNLVNHDVDISLLVWSLISFGDTFGTTEIESQTYSYTNTNGDWNATSDVDWLNITAETVEGITTLTLTPDVSDMISSGLSEGNLILTQSGTNKTQQVPVELGLDSLHLYANESALNFVSTGNMNETQKTISISSNAINAIAWQATSDAEWLTVTRIEDTDNLTVTVDPALVTQETLVNAAVTLSAPDNANVVEKTLPVSFYRSASIVDNTTIEELTANGAAMLTAPNMPYIYVAVGNELRIYHQYTEELLNTLMIAPVDTDLEQLIVHPEGTILLAKAIETTVVDDPETEENEEEKVTHRYKVNLADLTFETLADFDIQYEPAAFVRFAGRHFVVTQVMEFADENLMRQFWDPQNAFFSRSFDQPSHKDSLFALDSNAATFKRYTAKVNDFTVNALSTALTHEYKPESLGESDFITDFVVNNDESTLYAISPTTESISFDGEAFADNGLLETNEDIVTIALDKSNNGRAHFVRFDPTSGFLVNVYDEGQMLATTIPTNGSQPTNIALNADNKRLVLNASNSNEIQILNLRQFEVSADALTFNTTFGDAAVDEQTITLGGLGEGWQVASDMPWLIVTPVVSEDGNSITVSIDDSSISGWGLFTGTITVTDPASGTTTVITVKLAVDAVRITSNYSALSFNQLATQNMLTHTVDVLTNSENNIEWQASTEAAWLSLVPNAADNTLTITASPAMATGDGMFYATITLAALDENDGLPSLIEVSLNKGTADALDVSIASITPNSDGTVIDPLRPFLYVAQGDEILVYNVNSGALVKTITSPLADIELTNLVIHPNGSILLTSNLETYLDAEEVEQTRVNHYQVDLTSYEIAQKDSDLVDINYRPIAIEVVSGIDVVITQTLELANLSLEMQYFDAENAYFASTFDAPLSTTRFLAFKAADSSLENYTISVNAYAESTITAALDNSYQNDNLAGLSGIATKHDGVEIYTSAAATEWSSFDGTVYSDNGKLDNTANVSARNVAIDSANNSYFYRFDQSQGFVLSKYDNTQTLQWQQIITANGTSTQSYVMPSYQRVVTYNTATSSFDITSIQP